uniref:uncharacterized protein LOC105351553 n=1 Tax=Fragaria vesca subsp. vesca TaxID=101020 RepID=UPI0005CA49A6|nr:PREDICTED: uncharacterized protein LOC105351553 [Fragaria vesca subsp. vesca]
MANWHPCEEIQLCRSWVRFTTCTITGNRQSSNKLWEKIHGDFKANWEGNPDDCQSQQGLQSHWRNLKATLKVWHESLQKAAHNRRSGENLMDELKLIMPTKVKGKSLINKHVGRKLSNIGLSWIHQEPLLRPTFDSKETDSPTNLDEEEVLETPPSPSARPQGIKASKEAIRKGKKKQEKDDRVAIAIESLARSTAATVELIRKRDEDSRYHAARVLALEEEKEHTKIMSKDTTTLSPGSKLWWKKRKDAIKAKAGEDVSSSVEDTQWFD